MTKYKSLVSGKFEEIPRSARNDILSRVCRSFLKYKLYV